MANLHALDLYLDPTDNGGRFLDYDPARPAGRRWSVKPVDSGSWVIDPSDPDTDTHQFAQGDQLQIAVGASVATPGITSVEMSVLFAKLAKDRGNLTNIASPFKGPSGGAKCLFAEPVSTYQDWHFVGPFTIDLPAVPDPGHGSPIPGAGNKKFLKFEFSVVARVTFADGSVRDYSYDPEMDVEVI